MIRALLLAAAAAVLVAGPALAGPVTLKANPVDDDGRITLGDVFDGAGTMADMEIGRRVGPSIVFEAGQLQSMARQAGLDWANPTGLRRVVVRSVAAAPAVTEAPAALVRASAPASAAPVPAPPPAERPAVRPTGRAPQAERIIARNDMVEVVYEVSGVRLTVSGRAETNAAAGQRVGIRNLQSNRVIEAVAVAPGQAIAGPAAQAARQAS